MQILFVHENFPAQFGPVARALAQQPEYECVFVTGAASGLKDGIRCIPFATKGGALSTNHYCSRTFENQVWSAHAIYETCKANPKLKPDLVVAHSGLGPSAFLSELYDCPIVNLFEFYYHPHDSDMDFRPEFPGSELDLLRGRMRNAMLLIDLEGCSAGYCPTRWQQSLFPEVYRPKLEVIFDGMDTRAWRKRDVPRAIAGENFDPDTRIVTYVSRGFEAMRGFDIFIKVANRIAAEMSNVVFLVVGSDKVSYGGDHRHTEGASFREHVLAAETPDLERFRFLEPMPPARLNEVFSISDLHIYLTVPFVLSWSLLNALSCECTVLASDTAPVCEVIQHGRNGLLAGFYDVDSFVESALKVLRSPQDFRDLGHQGRKLIEADYSLDVVLPRFIEFFDQQRRR